MTTAGIRLTTFARPPVKHLARCQVRPGVNGLSGALLARNPNSTNTANGAGASNPFRLDRTQANTVDEDHASTTEQRAYDTGAADLFRSTRVRATLDHGKAGGITEMLDFGRRNQDLAERKLFLDSSTARR
ncbi:hypothetical protein SAMN05421548_112100 [Paraburkholderia lycopersici]|uniref:Uncharacterized protein n=1 Tax=Paraburkholderia lycopersici TaxID=416944 RepID=A0A1G6QSY0_9BURK|nr:hypothetical protein SAMN05421548_112100 [Paraburkholderia lycopersici]